MIKLGCCGWSYFRVNDFLEDYRDVNPEEKDWKEIYDHKVQAFADFFHLVEVNNTFYNLPQVKTAKKWKRLAREVNDDFEFTVKASKVITHKDRFASNKSVEKFKEVKTIAQALDSQLILLQTPPSFGPSQENKEDLDSFFSQIDRGNFKLVWEPRGDWEQNKGKIKDFCAEHDLIHCCDPFKLLPARETEISYLRLHGKPPGDEMYKYTFKKKDLKKLEKLLGKIEAEKKYLLFNNYNMYEDLKKFDEVRKENN